MYLPKVKCLLQALVLSNKTEVFDAKDWDEESLKQLITPYIPLADILVDSRFLREHLLNYRSISMDEVRQLQAYFSSLPNLS